MHVCIYMYVYACIYVYMYMLVCMCVCVCVCVCMYTYIHIHVVPASETSGRNIFVFFISMAAIFLFDKFVICTYISMLPTYI